MTHTDVTSTKAVRRRFVECLDPEESSKWSAAFAEVPRHVFVPAYHLQGPDGQWRHISWDDPAYLEGVYSDQALTTQLDERGIPTSSSSEPSLMLTMLEALDADAGDNVFELGTGTGYNACLLAHRVGDAHVTSMDVDPVLVHEAQQRCRQAGYQPHLHAGDATYGLARRGPYTKTIATFGLHNVPRALLGQSAPDAALVLPIGYGVAHLHSPQPGYGDGRFLPRPAYFMPRRTTQAGPDFARLDGQRARQSDTPPGDAVDRLRFPLSLALPDYHSCSWRDEGGALSAVGLWTDDGSVATAHISGAVRQDGPRALWDTVEDIARLFPVGIPAREDFGITITPTNQRVWYGEQDGPTWDLPSR
ncbi:methyltransferase domain-containing protein [Streptomyces sp. MZ04]|uniref:methyltransferase domain-containing protein n=1 Tax=Streptomyces sp. MZ04 TaxID=2559236 RepID=UPI00107EC218|nr:methyltransferase domain-containing protein [Streptomyces sp. MZ04]TGB05764.1 methyltransferase domain-containing protein [Streptomyces sp. MZ04]